MQLLEAFGICPRLIIFLSLLSASCIDLFLQKKSITILQS
ncbi:hypothetical protein PanWU01x14_126710 [Parasponia andersonii]|uniref:Uncharacterized protein n=1 Tax=Parasponia andersonii TaxID=3476 RepID=A0A2P5CSW6_PARAD|nr:hypothetical protein PanWU01x14_126710 [Parasponia andersonii]